MRKTNQMERENNLVKYAKKPHTQIYLDAPVSRNTYQMKLMSQTNYPRAYVDYVLEHSIPSAHMQACQTTRSIVARNLTFSS